MVAKDKNYGNSGAFVVFCGVCSCILIILALSLNQLSRYYSDGSLIICGYDKITDDQESVTILTIECNNMDHTDDIRQKFCNQQKVGLQWYWMLITSLCLSVIPLLIMTIQLNLCQSKCIHGGQRFENRINYMSNVGRWILIVSWMLCIIAAIIWKSISNETALCWQDSNNYVAGPSYVLTWCAVITFTLTITSNCWSLREQRNAKLNVILDEYQKEGQDHGCQDEDANYKLNFSNGEYSTFA